MIEALAMIWATASTTAFAEVRIASPDGRVVTIISDTDGLRLSAAVDGKSVLRPSVLGLRFKGNVAFGPTAKIVGVDASEINEPWENSFGTQRVVGNHCMQSTIQLKDGGRTFGLIVRVYDDGLAFRYDLPAASKLGEFVLTEELTELEFVGDAKCWAGEAGDSAEVNYPEMTLSAFANRGAAYLSEPPLLVQATGAYVAVAESDVIDWPAMFLSPSGTSRVRVRLAERSDGKGLVVSTAPRRSPWRVLMIGRKASDLIKSQLVATLATPSRLGNVEWVKPGVAAWDPWWTGQNPNLLQYTGVFARGDTKANKDYIDLAAEMGWRYQLIDWFWYENMTSFEKGLHSPPNAAFADFTKCTPGIDVKELVRYANTKNVKLLIWAHSLDLKTYGEERALSYLASLGVAGVKIDFLNARSQETVQWVEKVLALAAKYKLMINFHGTYHPTGLQRTFPNFVTQEGVLGNEYNKLPGRRNTPRHQITLPFTRALLGPMDYTPGGFLNRTAETFTEKDPTEVMGTRTRELALTVLYPSPLLVMCDAPNHYRSQRGVDFLRNLPTVWDETAVISAEVGKSVCLARRSDKTWYLVAINLDNAVVNIPLSFLSPGTYLLSAFEDIDDTNPALVKASNRSVTEQTVLKPRLANAGGFVAIITPLR